MNSQAKFSQEQIENMIENMSFDQFQQFIKYYLRESKNFEVEIIDGTNDGGNDCRIFRDGSLLKNNIQLTVQDNIDGKIKSDKKKRKIM